MSTLIPTRGQQQPLHAVDERRSLLSNFNPASWDLGTNELGHQRSGSARRISTLDLLAAKSSLVCSQFWGKRRNVLILSAVLAAVLIAAVVIPITVWMTTHSPVTLGSGEYVFATFHNFRDVLVFNVTTGDVWPPVENDDIISLLGGGSLVSELRQMLLLGDGSLLLAQSLTMNSIIMRLPNACSGHNLTAWIRFSLLHPYGLADNGRGTLYVTNQNSNLVTYYNSSTGGPLPPNAYFATVQNPRGIAVDPRTGNIYVSVRDEDLLVEYGENSGNTRLRTWKIGKPIQVIFHGGLLFVGGSANDEVLVIDLDNSSADPQILTDPLLKHPAGMALVKNTLLVMSQDRREILAWSQANRTVFTPLGVWKKDLPVQPEGLLFVQCK